MEKFSIISGMTCPKCKTLEAFCKSKEISFKLIREDINKNEFDEIVKKFNIRSVPVLIDNEKGEIVAIDVSDSIKFLRENKFA